MASDEPIEKPGWDAIDAALRPIYGEREPLHFASVPHHRLGGPSPLDGISAYARDEPIPHWHLITYGFSELYAKESEDRDLSGYGFELTFRLARRPGEDRPPAWALGFLSNLASYVFRTGNVFAEGHYMDGNGPIEEGGDTAIRAILLVRDPELPPIDTPNGRVTFLQVVGITDDELDAAQSWNPGGVAAILRDGNPLLVTDLARTSIRRDPAAEAGIRDGMARDGSSSDSLIVGVARFRVRSGLFGAPRLSITIGANGVRKLPALIRGRLPFGRSLTLVSSEAVIVLAPGDDNRWQPTGDRQLEIALTDRGASDLADVLVPKAGRYEVPGLPNAEIVVEKTVIQDARGNTVDVVG